MAYRFNSGMGGVTCDMCNILIDANLSYAEYEKIYEQNGHDGEFCWKCLKGIKDDKDRTDSGALSGKKFCRT
jgi:hypothetical protein